MTYYKEIKVMTKENQEWEIGTAEWNKGGIWLIARKQREKWLEIKRNRDYLEKIKIREERRLEINRENITAKMTKFPSE